MLYSVSCTEVTASQTANDALLLAKSEELARSSSLVSSSAASETSPAVVANNQAPAQGQAPARFGTRIKAISTFQSLFKRASLTEEEQSVTVDRELAKVRACILKTRGFSALDDQQVEKLLKSGRRRVFQGEEILIRQGDHDVGYFFVLIEGSLKYAVQHDSETPKSGLISCSDHGNVVGHFGSLYRRVRDSSVYSVPGAITWEFSFEGVPGPPSFAAPHACSLASHNCRRVCHASGAAQSSQEAVEPAKFE